MMSSLYELPELAQRGLQQFFGRLLDGLSDRKLLLRWPWLLRGYRYTNRYCNRISKHQLDLVSMLHAKHRVIKTSMTSTGAFHCYTDERLFVLPCGDVAASALAHSYRHWSQLQNSSWPTLLAYEFDYLEASSIYSMELLSPARGESDIAEALQSMRGHHSEPISNFSWRPLIQHLANFVDVSPLNPLCYATTEVIFGPVHGDLHPGNILTNQQGQRVLIDLDRFNFCAPQFIDDIHVLVCALEQNTHRSWLVILATEDVRGLNTCLEKILGYVVFRAAAETAWSPPGRRYRRRLKNCLSFLEGFEENAVLT